MQRMAFPTKVRKQTSNAIPVYLNNIPRRNYLAEKKEKKKRERKENNRKKARVNAS